jgi:hypothetical protein
MFVFAQTKSPQAQPTQNGPAARLRDKILWDISVVVT